MENSQTKLLEKLVSVGVVRKESYQGILYHYRNHGGYIVDAIIETGSIDEETLFKQLAQLYRTRFVVTEKLKRAEIPRDILDRVPVKIAQKHMVFPVLLDKKNSELSIVAVDPADVAMEQEVSQASGVPRVRMYIARPAAIKAAIAKFYRGDIHAFANLDRQGVEEYHTMLDVYERNLLDEETMATSLINENRPMERTLSAEDMERGAVRAKHEQDGVASVGQSGLDATLEILRVLVSLLERDRGDLAGHSIQTSHVTERMARRIGLSDRDVASLAMAALLHDLGKGSPYHLTPFNVAEWDGHRTAAAKRFENPVQLFHSVDLPEKTLATLRHMYERFDGQGLPSGMKGTDIPLGSRILAMSDTYSDLTSNPRNPYRKILSTEEAMQVLTQAKHKVFDPNLVDLFGIVVAGDDLKRQLLTGAQTILLVDSDAEQSAIFDLQLSTRGFKVRRARGAELALKIIKEDGVSLVVSEVDVEPFNGFELKSRLNQDETTANIPFVFYTARSASSDVERGFAVGAQDYIVKPSSIDIVAAKIHKYLDDKPGRAGEGVTGSLREMSLPDLVQILSHGRKSGQLKLMMGQHKGEIHFSDGEIFNALLDKLRGEEAFFQMLRFREGTFSLNPNFKAGSRVIQMTSEMLLLEGMRRFDEEHR